MDLRSARRPVVPPLFAIGTFVCMLCCTTVFQVCVVVLASRDARPQVLAPQVLASRDARPQDAEGVALIGVGGCLACSTVIWGIYLSVVRSSSCGGSYPPPSLRARVCLSGYLSVVSLHLSHISIGWCGVVRVGNLDVDHGRRWRNQRFHPVGRLPHRDVLLPLPVRNPCSGQHQGRALR
jgi:hypothetical protein